MIDFLSLWREFLPICFPGLLNSLGRRLIPHGKPSAPRCRIPTETVMKRPSFRDMLAFGRHWELNAYIAVSLVR